MGAKVTNSEFDPMPVFRGANPKLDLSNPDYGADMPLQHDPYPDVSEKFKMVFTNIVQFFPVKNAAHHNGIRYTGLLGSATECFGAAMRLPWMVLKAPDKGKSNKDKLKDVLADIIIYAVISLIHIENDNWDGEI